jgi:hypothetical protein
MRTSTSGSGARLAIFGTAALTAALGASVVTAPSASAGSSYVHLVASYANDWNHHLLIDGKLPAANLEQANAMKKYQPSFSLYGDDPYEDDALAWGMAMDKFVWGPATSTGTYFQAKVQVPDSTLNEDRPGKDEVYLKVNGVRSNTVSQRF